MKRGEGELIGGPTHKLGPHRRIIGENLSIGGEGMNLHYNKVLQQAANEVGKAFGVRVEEREVPAPTQSGKANTRGVWVHALDPEPGIPEEHTWGVFNASDRLISTHPDESTARKAAGLVDETEKVHYLPLTEEMKKALSEEGLALFIDDEEPTSNWQKVKGFTDQVGELLRASIAGSPHTAAVNLTSLHRMGLKEWVTSPVRATAAAIEAGVQRAAGNEKEANRLARASRMHLNTLRSLPSNYFPAMSDALADALHSLKHEGTKSGKFESILKLAEATAGKKHTERVRVLSTAELTPDTRLKRGLMILNVMGDRMGNRMFLGAAVDNLIKEYKVKTPEDLVNLAKTDPVKGAEIRQFMIEAIYEAQKATWNLPWTKSTLGGTIAQGVGRLPIIGLLTNPFAKAAFANGLANMLEVSPVLFMASRRVRDSFGHSLKRAQLAKAKDPKTIKRLKKQIRDLEETGIYSNAAILNRAATNSLLVGGIFYAWRMVRGNDGTLFDQIPMDEDDKGKVKQIARLTALLGEDLPAAMIGDYLAYLSLQEKDPSTPNPYQGKEGKNHWASLVQQSIYGSRYGLSNPVTGIIEGLLTGRAMDDDYIKEILRRTAADVGKMAGAIGPLGGTARTVAEVASPEERITRRVDEPEGESLLEQLPAAFKKGFQSQVPGWRQELPASPNWVSGEPRKRIGPVPSITGSLSQAERLFNEGKYGEALVAALPGAPRGELNAMDRFINQYQHKVSYRDVLPSQSDDPAFDNIYAKYYAEELGKQKLFERMDSPKVDKLPEEMKLRMFREVGRQVRIKALRRAEVEYKKVFGDLPDELKEKFLDNETRKDELRFLKRNRLVRPQRVPKEPKPAEFPR
jgi:hypothetical protein